MNNKNVSQADFMLFIPSCTLDMTNKSVKHNSHCSSHCAL